MARYVPKILEPVLNYVPDEGTEEIVSYASKAIRAKILLDREIRGFEKVDRKGPREAWENGSKRNEEPAHRGLIPPREPVEGYTHEQPRLSRVSAPLKDYISIVDIDYNSTRASGNKFYSYLQLPFVPGELDYNPASKFVGVASFGSNNPIYQYTGSEDTLKFTIDWFSEQSNRQDVIFNCRWLESLTKSNGYEEAPHRVKIIWGGQYSPNPFWEDLGTLFEDSVWLLVAAPYKLSQFNRGYRDPATDRFVSTNMLPQQAYQTVTFKRITGGNRTTREIIGNIGTPR